MNDYFAALMRSAGAPAAAPADAVQTAGSSAIESAEERFDLEQEVEVETGAMEVPGSRSTAPEPASAPVDTVIADPREREPIAMSESPRPTAAVPRPGLEQTGPVQEAPPVEAATLRQRRQDVHPVVRAALDWVGADPEASVRQGPAEPEPTKPPLATSLPPGTVPGPSAPDVARTQRSGTRGQALREAQLPHDAEPIDGRGAQQRPSTLDSPSRFVELHDRDRAPPIGRRDTGSQHRDPIVELSIGAIHVSIDAPAASTGKTPLPVAPPPVRAPSMSAASMGADPARSFSRRRLPRI